MLMSVVLLHVDLKLERAGNAEPLVGGTPPPITEVSHDQKIVQFSSFFRDEIPRASPGLHLSSLTFLTRKDSFLLIIFPPKWSGPHQDWPRQTCPDPWASWSTFLVSGLSVESPKRGSEKEPNEPGRVLVTNNSTPPRWIWAEKEFAGRRVNAHDQSYGPGFLKYAENVGSRRRGALPGRGPLSHQCQTLGAVTTRL